MPADALGLAFLAALVHAGWNLALAGAADPRATTAWAGGLLGLVTVPAALALGGVGADAVGWVVASVVLETAYLAALAAAYARAELSVVYPVARGSAPVLVLVGSLGSVTAVQALGVLVVGAGVVAVRGLGAPAARTDLVLALVVAACIAGYTLVDAEGVRRADLLPYLGLVLGLPGLLYAAGFGLWSGTAGAAPDGHAPSGTPRGERWRTLVVAAGMLAAFGCALAALQRGPAAGVSAVRECSVVVGVALARFVLGETVSAARWAGAALVAAGVAVIALA